MNLQISTNTNANDNIFLIFQEISEAGVEEENYFFRTTEAIFVGWFTLEYLIRFVVSPSKVRLFSEINTYY